MNLTDVEKNRAISEWLEPKPNGSCAARLAWKSTWHSAYEVPDGQPGFWFYDPLEWHADEKASAVLLERMPEPQLWIESTKSEPRIWGCWPDYSAEPGYAAHADRKIAIRDAFYGWIETQTAVSE